MPQHSAIGRRVGSRCCDGSRVLGVRTSATDGRREGRHCVTVRWAGVYLVPPVEVGRGRWEAASVKAKRLCVVGLAGTYCAGDMRNGKSRRKAR